MSAVTIRIALDLSCAMEHPMTGVGYTALHQARALLARDDGFDYRLFATRARNAPPGIPGVTDGFSRVTVIPYARRLKLALWSRLQWPPIEWFSGPVDIAHDFFHQLPAAKHAARLVTFHDLVVFRKPETHTRKTVKVHSALLRNGARRADACIAVSQSCKRDLMELLDMPADRVFVVPNGVCLEDFAGPVDTTALAGLKERLGISRDYWIHLGTIEPRKNLERLLTAYGRVLDRRKDCPQLLLVGKRGWMSDPVFARLDDPRLASHVVHAGYLDRAQAVALLRGASACVYPSLYEGFGLPVLEAMAARTPVVTSNVSSLPEVVGDTGIMIDPESIDEIEAALTGLLDNPDAARARVQPAYERACAFTWDASARALADVYRRVAG